jgi:tetratricopeptide (TPR) repeat protein
MRALHLALLLIMMVAGAPGLQAIPIKLVRDRFANSEVIKLNMQAQEQMMNGDLANAARTIKLAMQKDPTLWLTYFSRARLFTLENKYELAIQDCNWVLRQYPKFIEAALLRARANAHLRRYADSLKELDYLVRIRPHVDSYARAFRERAWLLATCPDRSIRNGGQALQDAKMACKLTKWTDDGALESLAAAYAETGGFDSALRYAEQALAVKDISPRDSKRVQRELALLKQHQPIRSS